MLESGGQPVEVEHAQAARGELQRERQPVQARDDLADRMRTFGGDVEARPDRPRAVDEEPDGLAAGQVVQVRSAFGQRERRHPELGLAGQPERDPAGRQHPHVRAPRRRRSEHGARLGELL